MGPHGSECLRRGLIILGFIQDGGSYLSDFLLLTNPHCCYRGEECNENCAHADSQVNRAVGGVKTAIR